MPKQRINGEILSWAMYDWANSAFATTVIAGFFPIFFKEYWSSGTEATLTTLKLGAANSIASVIVALSAPFLGAIADQGGARKRFLFFFASIGILTTGSLFSVARGDWQTAAFLYILGNVGFAGANVFYDSLIVNVAENHRMDFVSALGYSLGYLGGGLLFALNVLMSLRPDLFGLSDTAIAVRMSFISVALWWALFSIPILLFVNESKLNRITGGCRVARSGLHQLSVTFRNIRKLRAVSLFLIAYWLYIDGVDTIIRMAVDYGISLGFDSKTLIVALLITQFVGFPSAIVFGRIGARIGAKKGILIGIAVYVGVTIWGFVMDRQSEFYALAAIIGLVQGGVQALSRSFYTRIIPRNLAAEFFGFYNLLGKCAAVLGPALMGIISAKTGNPRLSILSITVFFVLGALILMRVDEEEGRRVAVEMETAHGAQ